MNKLHIITYGDPSVGISGFNFTIEFHDLDLEELVGYYENVRKEFKTDMKTLLEDWLDDRVKYCFFDDECVEHGLLNEKGECPQCLK